MKPNPLIISLLLIMSTFLAACDGQTPEMSLPAVVATTQQAMAEKSEPEVPPAPDNSADATEIDWDALIPADWEVDKLVEEYNTADLSDDDPRAKELLDKMKAFWKEAPVVHDFDGKTIKLPGFVVPLEMDTRTIQEFLLVPYYGACIHTPPPPSNQTVYVVTEKDNAYEGELFDTVWVTGTIKVERSSSELGEAGYRIDASKVEPYYDDPA